MPLVSRKTLVAIAAAARRCAGRRMRRLATTAPAAAASPAPAASDFPSAQGKTLRQIVLSAKGGRDPCVAPAAGYFHLGTNRFPFGVFTTGRQQITDATVALYAAPGRGIDGPGDRPIPGADRGPDHQAVLPGQVDRR